jgi:hypothetical protein
MNGVNRKAAMDAYRERKVEAGVYAVRCLPSGQVWVGRAPDLSTIQNRLWFTLRHGGSRHRDLQAAWTLHGADAFAFEIVERLSDEDMEYGRDRKLKALLGRWTVALQAAPI